jgi:hypothetical protein
MQTFIKSQQIVCSAASNASISRLIPWSRSATRGKIFQWASVLISVTILTSQAVAQSFFFSTGDPDGRIATAGRFSDSGQQIESADDFLLDQETLIQHATFTGLLPPGTRANDIEVVDVAIYPVFPENSQNPPSGNVPTRVNSPADDEIDARNSEEGTLHFGLAIVQDNFTAENSVLNGINPIPNQTTGGEGPVSGEEVRFVVTFSTPFDLPAGHYFFVPTVKVSEGEFFWLSAPKPIVAPGTPFTPDLQSWMRNEALAPDWLRIGTDIVGGSPPPTFNASFSLHGRVAHGPSSAE